MPLALSPRLDPVQADTRELRAPVPRVLADAPVNDNTPAPAADNAAPAGVQKRTRGTSRTSALADRQFLHEFKALTSPAVYLGAAPSTEPAIVSVSKGDDLSDPLPQTTKTPRPWRDATDEVHAHFALEALRERGSVVAFTAWVSAEIDAKARATGAPLPWLRNRLQKALHAALGASEWLASIEEERAQDGKLLLHMHGAGAFGELTRSRRKAIRAAFQRALGAWEGPAARYQVKLALVRDAGWAGYCTKRAWLARPGIRAILAWARPGSQWRLSFDGPVFTVTNGARARAKELHETARRIVLEAHEATKKPTSPETASAPSTAVCESRGASCEAVAARTGTTSSRSFALGSTPETHAPFTPTTTSRSRDPPGPGPGASAGPDPPLPELLLEGQVAEHELPALAVAQGDVRGAGHEAGLPRHDGLAAHLGAALDRDDDGRVRVSHRSSAGETGRAQALFHSGLGTGSSR